MEQVPSPSLPPSSVVRARPQASSPQQTHYGAAPRQSQSARGQGSSVPRRPRVPASSGNLQGACSESRLQARPSSVTRRPRVRVSLESLRLLLTLPCSEMRQRARPFSATSPSKRKRKAKMMMMSARAATVHQLTLQQNRLPSQARVSALRSMPIHGRVASIKR